MRIIRIIPALLAVLFAACGDATGPRAPYGTWLHSQESEAAPAGEWWREDWRLTLRPDGTYTSGRRVWADWGRPGDKLLGYSARAGGYEIRNDSLFMTVARAEDWDYLTGGPRISNQEHVGPRFGVVRFTRFRLVLQPETYDIRVPEIEFRRID